MPSNGKKRTQKKRAQRKKKQQTANKNKEQVPMVAPEVQPAADDPAPEELELTTEEALCMKLEAEAKVNSEEPSPNPREVRIANFSITFYGSELLQDTRLELNCGRRYGLVGRNGSVSELELVNPESLD